MCKPSDEDLLAELNGSVVDGLISGFPYRLSATWDLATR